MGFCMVPNDTQVCQHKFQTVSTVRSLEQKKWLNWEWEHSKQERDRENRKSSGRTQNLKHCAPPAPTPLLWNFIYQSKTKKLYLPTRTLKGRMTLVAFSWKPYMQVNLQFSWSLLQTFVKVEYLEKWFIWFSQMPYKRLMLEMKMGEDLILQSTERSDTTENEPK